MRLRSALLLLGAVASSALRAAEIPLEIPEPADARLQVSLYAADPDIRTPIGAAVDARGRLFVVESHTHLQASDYPGPKHDLIKIFEGRRPDGRAAAVQTFADDIDEAMNIVFGPDGTLYVCTAKVVYALHDRDGDDRADEKKTILSLDTAQTYPHSQLLGIALSADGWLYVTRGNIGGFAYAWVGSDGKRIEGYGEGGDIVRCRTDGTGLEHVATGFWNPFDLKYDRHGRLLAIDNDPDSRGPNRLLQIVMDGDYGYKALYGPTGLHPYDAWEGDLPGTLPMIAGVGESPSGVLDLSFAALPAEYRDTAVVTVWGEHNLTLYRLRPAGSSLTATSEVFLRGGQYFRPVAVVAAPDGTVYITDWILKDYPNHGYGRIWKLTAKPGIPVMTPAKAAATDVELPELARLERLRTANQASDYPKLRSALLEPDAFVRSAAISGLGHPAFREQLHKDLEASESAVRLGTLLALRRAKIANPAPVLRPRLKDSDPEVRQMALIWTGERILKSLAADVEASIALPGLTTRLFDTWLATIQILSSDAEELQAKKTPGSRIKRDIGPAFIETLVKDEARPAAVRALALRRLTHPDKDGNRTVLLGLARQAEPQLQLEAIRTLATSSHPDTAVALRAVALDRRQPPNARAEALLALAAQADASLLPLLDDPEPAVRIQAARTLRFAAGMPAVKAAFERKLASLAQSPADAALAQQLRLALDPTSVKRPESLDEWQQELATGGDLEAGRRVFFSPLAVCAQCHKLDGRGGVIGPDLSVVGRTANRARLIHSILKPSDDVAPQFQGWEVRTKSGDIITGLQGHLRTGGSVSIIPLDGQTINIPGSNVAYFGAMPNSLMPEGLTNSLAPEEFRDLIAFLASLK